MSELSPKEQLRAALESEWRAKHPTFPSEYRGTKKAKKSDDGSKALENNIKRQVQLDGGECEIVHTKGTYRKDIGKYTSGNYTVGSSDCHIMLWSNTGQLIVWKCEVKWKKDSQKKGQEEYQELIESFGRKGNNNHRGHVVYSIVKTFDDFYEQYHKLKCI